MLRRIFVPLENSTSIDSTIKHACFIANNQNAIVTAGVFFDIPGVEKPLGNISDNKIIWSDDIDKKIIADVENTAMHLMNKLKSECKKSKIKFSLLEDVGIPIKDLGEIVKYYDILVTGLKSEFRVAKRKYDSSYLNQILNYGVAPVLAVPHAFRKIKNIVIAFDGSVSSSRALQRFAHIANISKFNIKIFMSTDDQEFGVKNLTEAKNLLKAYGAEKVAVEWTGKDIFTALNSFFDFPPDLIVIGLHSKKFLKDYFIGSVTEHLIKRADIPLFIGI